MSLPILSRTIAIALGVGISEPALSSAPSIGIMIVNDADAPPDVIARAQDMVSHIFFEAGIQTRWQQCDLPICPPPRNPTVIGVVINSDAAPRASRTALGVSLPGIGQGNRVGVFYSRIERVSRDPAISLKASVAEILAHVIAHEIGHLLLNQKIHSKEGIMRTEWTHVEFAAMRERKLFFTPSEAGAMRRDVQKRMSAWAHSSDVN